MSNHDNVCFPTLPSSTTASPTRSEAIPGSSCSLTFPYRLHDMLTEVHKDGLTQIVSFQGNMHFKVNNRELFETIILPKYFRTQSRCKSFQRQLAMYGFHREIAGPRKGAYTHQYLMRGDRDMCGQMIRHKVSSSSSKGLPSSSMARMFRRTVHSIHHNPVSATDIMDISLSRGMEKVGMPPSLVLVLPKEESTSSSRSGHPIPNKKSSNDLLRHDRTEYNTLGALPVDQVDSTPTLIDSIKDARLYPSICTHKPLHPFSFLCGDINQSELEPISADSNLQGFTADIADEVIRTFRFVSKGRSV